MKKIFAGRYVTDAKTDFVLLIIGMRVNNLLAFRKWIPVAKAMGPMIKELYQNPELGFIHTEVSLSWRGVTLIQYWRSFEDLEAYAHGRIHMRAWTRFNKKTKGNDAVGIFHETYRIEKGSTEGIYVNMPKTGLAHVTTHEPVTKEMNTSRMRLMK
ncbi:transcriptional regulator [Bacillus sp. FJAT-27916]|uniref:DUF4188 domain-containing protein n=1 Tax=Bacillus sp. FJAT-27916 TaxID=1679169 RepID=UPI000671740C|nr:DUF4188 domain-containing protein [Bacillus sp. FJAT-27916]KMY44314.1 transcriptional regulator [Bacillus sp. FJAT-27916]